MKLNGKEINKVWYSILLLMGFGAFGYHGYWLIDTCFHKHSD